MKKDKFDSDMAPFRDLKRHRNKKIVNALRSNDISALMDEDEDELY